MKLHNGQLKAALNIAAVLVAAGGIGVAAYSMFRGASVVDSAGFAALMAGVAVFTAILARASFLQQQWARVVGLLLATSFLLMPPYLTFIGLALIFGYIFCWKYQDEAAMERARISRWPFVPFTSRYGVAVSVLCFGVILSEDVAPGFVEVYGKDSEGAWTAVQLAEANGLIGLLILAVLTLWWIYPPTTRRGMKYAKASVIVAVTVLATSIIALYAPIFLMSEK